MSPHFVATELTGKFEVQYTDIISRLVGLSVRDGGGGGWDGVLIE